MAGSVIDVTSTNFDQEVRQSPVPVLVDMWAAWCVDPQSHVLLDWRNSCEARSVSPGQRVLSLHEEGLQSGNVAQAVVSSSLGHCREIRTETGRRLRVTDDHRFLTQQGWKPAARLRVGMGVAIYPTLEETALGTSHQWVLTRRGIDQVSLPRMKLQGYLEELTKEALIPLKTNHPKLPVITRLMGALFSDGHLYHQGSNNYRELMWVVGRCEDARQIQDDLASLGFTAQIRERTTSNCIDGRSFSAHTYRVKCLSTKAWLLFKALGVPEGKKTDCAYLIPNWLRKATQLIQREFLAGYLGGDGPTPTIRLMPRPSKHPCDHLHFNDIEFHKRTDLAANGYRFAQQLATLLGQFGVQVRGVHIEKGSAPRKDGSRTVTVHLQLSATYESGYAICHRIGYAYAASKSAEAQKIGEFLRKKLFERDDWQRRYRQAKSLDKQGCAIPVIAKQLRLPYNTAFDWLRRGVSATIQQHHERYAGWLERVTAGGRGEVLWERVVSVRPIYLPTVSRLSVTPQHNFIAEGFIVHNCGPCRMLAPVVEELAGKYQGKLKVGKVNVDEHPQVAAEFRIMNIPTLLLFKAGQEVDRIVGVQPKEELVRRIEKVLA